MPFEKIRPKTSLKTRAALNTAILLSSGSASLAAGPSGVVPVLSGNQGTAPHNSPVIHNLWSLPAAGTGKGTSNVGSGRWPGLNSSGRSGGSISSTSRSLPLVNHRDAYQGLPSITRTAFPGTASRLSSPAFNLGGRGLSLDLSSAATDVVLGAGVFKGAGSATVTVGGVSRTFSPGQKVTAGEYLAIKEVLSGVTQTLTLDAAGVATGGDFNLNMVSSRTGLLIVPAGVIGIDNVSSGHGLSIKGDILNYGTIYGLSTNSQITTAGISAKDVVNESGGLISTDIPGLLLNTLGPVNDATNLTILASRSISNSGTIGSSGNINLLSGGGNISNAGLVLSSAGNVNLSACGRSANLTVNASGGTFSVAGGNIDLHTAGSGNVGNINMIGGNYLSNQLNISAPSGSITGNVGQVSGTVNTKSNATHLIADSTSMLLGDNSAKGDPTYVNTGGSIVIDGAVTAGEAITILASQDITVQAGSNASISTRQVSGDGSDITLIAGASVSTSGSSVGGPIPENSPIGAGTSASVNFTSGTGGNINLSGSSATGPIIDSGSNTGNAGNVTLAAYANGSTGGSIIVPAGGGGMAISTTATAGSGGNVRIIAGANPSTPGTTVTMGGTIQTSGVVNSGAVSIVAANPDSSDNSHIVSWNSNGAVTSGNSVMAGSAIASNAQISTADIITAGGGGGGAGQGSGVAGAAGGNAGALLILAGSGISTGNLLAYGGGGGGGEAAGTTGGAGGNGGSITLGTLANATGIVSVIGQVNSSGGGGGGATLAAGGAGGLGGAININATDLVQVGGALYAADGGNGETGTSATIGGGGGGSFGGGGGGSGATTSGAGGGGGYFGGGGGGSASGGGGSGGGAFGGGNGGNGTNSGGGGQSQSGGSGSPGSALLGGSLGNGGQGQFTGESVPGLTSNAKSTQNQDIFITGNGISLQGTAFGRNLTFSETASSNADFNVGRQYTATNDFSISVSGTGTINNTGGTIDAFSLSLTSLNGDFGSAKTPLLMDVGELSLSTTGNVYLNNVAPASIFQQNLGLENAHANNITITTNTYFEPFDPVTIAGSFNINASSYTSLGTVTAGSVQLNGLTTTAFDVQSNFVATSGNIVINSGAGANVIVDYGTMKVSGSNQVVINAVAASPTSSNEILLASTTAVTTDAAGSLVLNATGQNQHIGSIAFSTLTTNNLLVINTNVLSIGGIVNGSSIQFNSPIGAGTIANSSGNLSFTSGLTYHGQSLNIIASGNITMSGNNTIDLSGNDSTLNGGNGGSLNIIAGFNFTPASSSGNTPNNLYYSFDGTTSKSGGSISMPNTTILTGSSVSGASGGDVQIVSAPGSTNSGTVNVGTINTSVTGANSYGGSVTVFGQGITVGNINTTGGNTGGQVALESGAGSLIAKVYAAGGFINGPGGFSLSSSSGNIVIGGINAGNGTVIVGTSGSGSVTGTSSANPVISSDFDVVSGTGGIGSASQPIYTQVTGLGINPGASAAVGSAYINNSASSATLDIGINGNIIANNLTILTGGAIVANGPAIPSGGGSILILPVTITVTGTLTLNTTGLSSTEGISAGNVQITGVAGQPLTIANDGTITATKGNIIINSAVDQNVLVGSTSSPSASMTVVGSNSITINANGSGSSSSNQIIFNGSQSFDTGTSGATNFNANASSKQAVTIDAGASVSGNNKLVVTSSNLDILGTLVANPLIFNSPTSAGTIANSSGDLNLGSNLVYHGRDLAIIASGSVNLSGTINIDLSGTSASLNQGDAGSLTVVAGFNFSPTASGGSSPVPTTFTLITPSTGGGNVSLAGATITTNSTVAGSSGGNVLVVASGGSTNAGAIILGSINSGAGGAGSVGGAVTIIAQGGVTTGAINTAAATSGPVTIISGAPQITGGAVSLINGTVTGAGSFSVSSAGAGNISLGQVNAGSADIALTTGGVGSVAAPSLAGGNVTLTSGTGGIGTQATPISVTANQVSATAGSSGNAGNIYLNATPIANLTLGSILGASVSIVSSGPIVTTQAINASGSLSIIANSFTNANAITAGSILIAANSAANLNITNTGTITATSGNIEVDGAPGYNVNIGNGGGSNPGGTFTVSGANNFIAYAPGSSPQSANQIIFNGNQNFVTDTTGNVVLTANTGSNQSVTVNSGVTVNSNYTLTVNATTLNLQGQINASPLVYNSGQQSGTIANSSGNVVLTSDLIYHGQDLAIVASGNVSMVGNHVIDLSGIDSSFNGGNGGNLSVIAGFSFTPGTGGQVGPVSTVYTLDGGYSLVGGCVNLSTAIISTGSTISGATGGNVLIAASGFGASSLLQSVNVGTINTSSSGSGSAGGNVTILGAGNVVLGTINTTAATSGSVSITDIRQQIVGGSIVVTQGTLSGSGSFSNWIAPNSGTILLSGINAGSATVNIFGGTGSIITGTTATAPIIAGTLNISADASNIGSPSNPLNSQLSLLSANVGIGNVYIADTGAGVTTTGTNQALSYNLSAKNITVATPITTQSISLNAPGGNISLPLGGLSVEILLEQAPSPSFTLNANTITGAAGKPISLSYVQSGPPFGPEANVSVTTNTSTPLTIGSGDGQFLINSGAAGYGGSLSFVNNGGPIAIATAGGITDVLGNISLTATAITNTSGSGPVTLNVGIGGTGTGNGGSISLSILGNQQTTIGSGNGDFNLIANAGAGGGNGGSITIKSQGALVVDPTALNISSGSSSTSNGGILNLTASSISNLGSGPLVLNASGSGSGGTITIDIGGTAPQSIAATGTFQLQASGGANGASGGTINFATQGTLAIDTSNPANLNIGVTAANGNGGIINLTAASFSNASATPTAALQISANAKGTGNGGAISLTQLANAAVSIGTGAGDFELSASGGSLRSTAGNGGSVSFITGSDLTVDPAAITISPLGSKGNGGTISLESGSGVAAGAGNLLVTGNLNVNAKGSATGGQISLVSNGTGDGGVFSVGLSKTNPSTINGITGTISATGSKGNGTIALSNQNGSINVSDPLTAFSRVSVSAQNGITASGALGSAKTTALNLAAGSGGILYTNSTALTATAIVLSSNASDIGTAAVPIHTKAGILTVNTSGSIDISNVSTALTLNASSVGGAGTFSLATSGALLIGGNIAGGADLTLKSSTSQGIAANSQAQVLTAGSITLDGGAKGIGGATQALTVKASELAVDSLSGPAYINSVGSQDLTLLSSNDSKLLTLNASGNIVITGTVCSKTAIVTIISQNGSIFSDGSDTSTIFGKAVTVAANNNGGTLGLVSVLGNTPLDIFATTLTANALGAVEIANINAAASTLNNSSGSSFEYTCGAATIRNITATNGSISVISTSTLLQTAAQSTIQATNGSILLAQQYGRGNIVIGKQTTITTDGASGGNVTITNGAPIDVISATPANVAVNQIGGTVYFGPNGITASAPINTITAKNADVVFYSFDRTATAIKLGGGVNITADPPGAASLVQSVGAGVSGLPSASSVSPELIASSALLSAPYNTSLSLPHPISDLVATSVLNLPASQALTGYQTLSQAQTNPAFLHTNIGHQSTFVDGSANASYAASVSLQPQITIAASRNIVPEAVLESLRDGEVWVSETELASGEIPASVHCDNRFEILSHITIISDLHESEGSPLGKSFGKAEQNDASTTLQGRVTVSNSRIQNVAAREKRIENHRLNNEGHNLSLSRGSVIFAPALNTTVKTPLGDIFIAAKSLVLVLASSAGLAIYDLHDSETGAVRASVQGKSFTLSPGRGIVFAESPTTNLAEVNPARLFFYRNICQQQVDSNISAFTCEFSMAQAVQCIPAIRQIISSEAQEAQRFANRLLKTASILQDLGARGPRFEQACQTR